MGIKASTRHIAAMLTACALGAMLFASGASAQTVPFMKDQTIKDQGLQLGSNGSTTSDLNWAGYTATGGTYTSVSGSWIVPTIQDAGAVNVADATWVGIGGVESTDLIQAGTEAIPTSSGGLVYQAWYEMLPQNSTAVPLTVSPGDAVTVSITGIGNGQWEISFDNTTTGRTYATKVNYVSSLSSADWIEEMPVEVGGVIGLDDFGTLQFTTGYTIKNGQVETIQAAGATPLTMENSQGAAVATPSALGPTGSTFSVSRTDAQSTPLALSETAGIPSVSIASVYTARGSYGSGGYIVRMRRGRGGYGIVLQFSSGAL